MEDRIKELEDEIDSLEERLARLEKVDAKRRVLKLFKSIIVFLLLITIGYGIYRGYNYVKNELPKVIDEKVNDLKDNVIKKNEN